jgi:hypothetical protein
LQKCYRATFPGYDEDRIVPVFSDLTKW